MATARSGRRRLVPRGTMPVASGLARSLLKAGNKRETDAPQHIQRRFSASARNRVQRLLYITCLFYHFIVTYIIMRGLAVRGREAYGWPAHARDTMKATKRRRLLGFFDFHYGPKATGRTSLFPGVLYRFVHIPESSIQEQVRANAECEFGLICPCNWLFFFSFLTTKPEIYTRDLAGLHTSTGMGWGTVRWKTMLATTCERHLTLWKREKGKW